MLLRMIAIVLAILVVERAAEACCVGCACTKYKHRLERPHELKVIDEPVYGYTHSVTGAIPRWSHARIAKFLGTGIWKPVTPRSIPKDVVVARLEPNARVIPAPSIQFRTADKITGGTVSAQVIIRRIEKHGNAILVEVDERTFKLAPCPRQKNTACLVDPGELALAPIPPPDAATGFSRPPD